ncbi:hypothetical protein TVAG_024430 [Trichomonas vaginalis G3]|uniref:RING-type E3 ubiquitin transferase n=1 Tax=Trichomonas vaginalis (strain ATCC PRA-98 / G3) TaxID=412133 RepID=A2G637_TRIV3|nr:RING finger ubiquitin ligase family [Trichomonas vaginalis G3]EAX87377.1 hypothetical protein TVAG_024430 [Trichomonas vaginalis G3]KAI5503150.1 RING finger ubiquitin ligase family [Trichomonas vaginalis G3]|eukprot:XP_001300307.1 hypothetical protein [Trichomonas vaginalis G3]
MIYNGRWKCDKYKDEASLAVVRMGCGHLKNSSFFAAEFQFQNGTYIKFSKMAEFHGINYPNSDNIYLFNYFSKNEINMTEMLLFTNRSLYNSNGEPFNDIKEANSNLNKSLSIFYPNTSLIGISLHRTPNFSRVTKFHPGFSYNGSCLTCEIPIIFELEYMEHELLAMEYKIFAVFAAFLTILKYYGYKLILQHADTQVRAKRLSVYSLVFNMCYDYSYNIFFPNDYLTFPSQNSLYLFVYSVNVFIHFSLLIPLTVKTILAQTRFTPENFRGQGGWLFTRIFILMLLISGLKDISFKHPILIILLIEAQLIPQLFRSIKDNERDFISVHGIILISLIRISHIAYFGIYKNNIKETYFPRLSLVIIAAIVIQVALMIFVNKYGSKCILPKSLRPKSFDYRSIPIPPNSECAICMCNIEDGEPTMMTPCGHPFHSQCLERWMQEQLVCPICRAPLLPEV